MIVGQLNTNFGGRKVVQRRETITDDNCAFEALVYWGHAHRNTRTMQETRSAGTFQIEMSVMSCRSAKLLKSEKCDKMQRTSLYLLVNLLKWLRTS